MIVSKPGGISKGNFSVLCKQTDPGDFMVASPALLIEGKCGIANTELETQELKIFFVGCSSKQNTVSFFLLQQYTLSKIKK